LPALFAIGSKTTADCCRRAEVNIWRDVSAIWQPSGVRIKSVKIPQQIGCEFFEIYPMGLRILKMDKDFFIK